MSILDRYTGMEELLENGADNLEDGVTEAAVEEVRADIAEVVAEVEQVAAEVEELRDDLEEHEEVVEELAEEVEGLESMLSSGQFSSVGFAHSYNKALRLNAKLGGQSFERLGAESISDAATAKIASVTGVEAFMDTVKNAGKKAAEFIKAIFNTVINFFVGLFSTAAGIDRRRAQLADKLGKADKLKEKIKLGKWNVGIDYAKNGADILDKGPFTKVLSESLPAFIDIGKNLDGVNASQFKTAYNSLVADVKAVVKETGGNAAEKASGDKRQVLAARAGFGIYLTYEEKVDTDEDVLAAARSVKLSFGKNKEAAEFAKGEVAVKATKAQLESLLKTVSATVFVLKDSKISQKFSKAERDRVVGTLNAKGGDKDAKADTDKAIKLVRALYSTGASLTQSVNRLLAYQAKQSLDLVAAHL